MASISKTCKTCPTFSFEIKYTAFKKKKVIFVCFFLEKNCDFYFCNAERKEKRPPPLSYTLVHTVVQACPFVSVFAVFVKPNRLAV